MKQPIPNNPTHRLLIKEVDPQQPIFTDSNGIKHIPMQWKEVIEINLGSINKPTAECKKIYGIRLEPIFYEKEDSDPFKNFKNIFGGMK
jgi:hypothetical protein